MEKENTLITIIDEEGNEKEATIILTHERDGVNYVVFEIEEEEIISACRFEETNGEEGVLTQIETDEEWDMIEDLLENFFAELDDLEEDEE